MPLASPDANNIVNGTITFKIIEMRGNMTFFR